MSIEPIQSLPDLWPHQARGLDETIALLESGVRRILLTAPTGSGKSRLMQELIAWAIEKGKNVVLYTNRNLLREQTSRVLSKWGVSHGVRAAGVSPDLDQAVQLSSIQTESCRVFDRKKKKRRRDAEGVVVEEIEEDVKAVWEHHRADLVLCDEIHMCGGNNLRRLKELHERDGAQFVDVTATPLDINEAYDALVQAGNNTECRRVGALLLARHYAINEPDTARVRANPAGEYEIEPGRYRRIWIHSIVGSVIENYDRLNPDRLPTILFAPGVDESVWFAERFTEAGHRWAHIDGSKVWVDGEFHQGKDDRDAIIEDVRRGKIKGVSNRFVLREGIDMPELFMGILATVFGSLQSYLQSVGRVLRNHPSLPGYVVLQDHGGNWWRHGSANVDRRWEIGQESRIEAALRENRIRNKEEKLPMRCPACGALRDGGVSCHACGSRLEMSRSRMVVQEDGELVERNDGILRPKYVKVEPDSEKRWKSMYYRCKRANMTFRQAAGLFVHENGYWLPDTMPLMPREVMDTFKRIKDVPVDKLY